MIVWTEIRRVLYTTRFGRMAIYRLFYRSLSISGYTVVDHLKNVNWDFTTIYVQKRTVAVLGHISMPFPPYSLGTCKFFPFPTFTDTSNVFRGLISTASGSFYSDSVRLRRLTQVPTYSFLKTKRLKTKQKHTLAFKQTLNTRNNGLRFFVPFVYF